MKRWLLGIALATAACGGAAPEKRVETGGGMAIESAQPVATATSPTGAAPPPPDGMCTAEKPACNEAPLEKDRVAAGGSNVTGKLPPEVIERGVRASINKIRFCYQSALAKDPGLRGTVKIKFVIGPGGLVEHAADEGSQLSNAAVIECVRAEILRLKFPSPEGGSVIVVHPFVFEPSP